MPVVNGTAHTPAGDRSPNLLRVTFELVDGVGDPVETAFVASTGAAVVGRSDATLASDGTWTINVPGNGAITPTGTRWRRRILNKSGSGDRSPAALLNVPVSPGPYNELDILAAQLAPAAPAPLTATRPLVSVEDGWTTRLAARKAAASDRLFRAIGFGDSLGVGYYSSDFRENGFMSLIAAALQGELGDGGSGWIDSAWAPFFFLPEASGQWATVGAWTGVPGGPGWATDRPTVAGNGATITAPFRGTTLDIVQRRGSGFGSWTYAIDGGSAVAVSAANATADVHTTTVTGLAEGDHTVVITATTGDCRIAGIRGRNATGAVFDNYSRGSAAYQNVVASLNLLRAADGIAGATTLSTTVGMHDVIDLAVFGLGVNDALDTEVTAAGLETVLHSVWDELRRKGPDGEPPLIVVILPHVGKHDDADVSPEYPRVTSTLRTWATSIGAAVVDVWAEGRRSWDYFDGLGAWGELSPGSPDNVHLSDVGHEITAASAIGLLTA